MIIKRPKLNSVPIPEDFTRAGVMVTMSEGYWDGFLQAAYDAGATLIEVDDAEGNEEIVAAYRAVTA